MPRRSHLRLVGPGERAPAKTLRLEDLDDRRLALHDANVLYAVLDGWLSPEQARTTLERCARSLAHFAQTPPSEAAVPTGDPDSPPVA